MGAIMLRAALNVDSKTHMTNKELYGDTPQITTEIKARRLTFAGHCKRAEGCIVSKLVTGGDQLKEQDPKDNPRRPVDLLL